MENKVDEVKLLISQGANVNQQDKLSNTPLLLAAFLGRTD